MAHLLMIENWVGGTGRLLPATIKQLGHDFTFVTRNTSHYLNNHTREIHPVMEHARHVLQTETNDIPALITFLQQQHAILGFDGVLTICDYYIDTVAQVAQALKLPQAFPANVAMERRKDQVREAIARAGLPNPRFEITTSWEATLQAAMAIGYPLIIKPTDLASSAFVRLVQNSAELREAYDAIGSFTRNFRDQAREPRWLLEEFMVGVEFSVEAITYRGETTILGITDKSVTGRPYFIEDGHMFPAALPETDALAITTLVQQVLKAVGHEHGISHTEVMLTQQGPRIVEINPRPGGNYIAELVQRVTGIDLLKALVELALGQQPDLQRQQTGVHSAAIQFLVPMQGGKLAAMHGLAALDQNPHLVRHQISDMSGKDIAAPIDNGCYLGHVMTIDRNGMHARTYAEQALRQIELVFDSAA